MDIIGDGHTVTELKASTDKSSFHSSFRLLLSSSPNPFGILHCVCPTHNTNPVISRPTIIRDMHLYPELCSSCAAAQLWVTTILHPEMDDFMSRPPGKFCGMNNPMNE